VLIAIKNIFRLLNDPDKHKDFMTLKVRAALMKCNPTIADVMPLFPISIGHTHIVAPVAALRWSRSKILRPGSSTRMCCC
jgi:hypothetical protein